MKYLFLNIFLSVVILGHAIGVSHAQESVRPVIIWAKQDLLPFYIFEGPFKGQGVSDKLQAFFSNKLPEYEHRIQEMSFDRVMEQAGQGQLVCNAMILKTPLRAANLHFSNPLKPGYEHLFIASVGEHDEKTINLDDFFHNYNHKLIVQSGRSYGPFLDEKLSHGEEYGKVDHHQIATEKLYKKVLNRRHEHFIDVEISLSYYLTIHDDATTLVGIPISGGKSAHYSYAACSFTNDGEIVIEKIDKILSENAKTAEFQSIIESWIPEESLSAFRKRYEKEILVQYQ